MPKVTGPRACGCPGSTPGRGLMRNVKRSCEFFIWRHRDRAWVEVTKSQYVRYVVRFADANHPAKHFEYHDAPAPLEIACDQRQPWRYRTMHTRASFDEVRSVALVASNDWRAHV